MHCAYTSSGGRYFRIEKADPTAKSTQVSINVLSAAVEQKREDDQVSFDDPMLTIYGKDDVTVQKICW